jgi:hypothetical protein
VESIAKRKESSRNPGSDGAIWTSFQSIAFPDFVSGGSLLFLILYQEACFSWFCIRKLAFPGFVSGHRFSDAAGALFLKPLQGPPPQSH